MPSLATDRSWGRRALLGLLALTAVLLVRALSAYETGALPGDVAQLLEAEPLPPVAVGPRRRYLLLAHEHRLLPLDLLAEPAVEVAGRRVNPRTAARHAPIDYFALTLVDLETGREKQIPLPSDAIVGFPIWAPDGSKFAFTLRQQGAAELWVGDPRTARATPVVRELNESRGTPCSWMPDSRRLICKQLTAEPAPLGDSGAFAARYMQQTAFGQPAMLSRELTRTLLESQLVLIDSLTGRRREIGPQSAVDSVEPAPDGDTLLVRRILEPYPRVSGVDRLRLSTEVWNRFGETLRVLPEGVRAVGWHAARPATLTWVARRDGADRVMQLPPPYSEAPREVFALEHGFSGLEWLGETPNALVNDYDPSTQRTTVWRVSFEEPDARAEKLATHESGALPTPIMRPNALGADAVLVVDGAFYVHGQTSSEAGDRAFLDRVSVETGATRRIWQARETGYETLVDVLDADGARLLTRRETSTQPPDYFVTDDADRGLWAVTEREHPAPALTEARQIRLTYDRADGVRLGATLHLPPGYAGDERLPLVVWAYPYRVPSAETVQPAKLADERFPSYERAFRLFFLLRDYAVLDDVSMPIVGSRGDANDTFIEQIVANARAAIDAAGGTGLVDSSRVGVAGHSYGAFMVANLLAHSQLFGAGAALSGAYNRTLTPFGFQTERRTLWEAPDTYLAMSPILYSQKIEAPLLLVHGMLDDNAGTSPLQSTQFYQAIKGNGGNAKLLLLPWEGHSYRARESVLQTAASMLDWFDRYLKPESGAEFDPGERQAGAYAPPAAESVFGSAQPRH